MNGGMKGRTGVRSSGPVLGEFPLAFVDNKLSRFSAMSAGENHVAKFGSSGSKKRWKSWSTMRSTYCMTITS